MARLITYLILLALTIITQAIPSIPRPRSPSTSEPGDAALPSLTSVVTINDVSKFSTLIVYEGSATTTSSVRPPPTAFTLSSASADTSITPITTPAASAGTESATDLNAAAPSSTSAGSRRVGTATAVVGLMVAVGMLGVGSSWI